MPRTVADLYNIVSDAYTRPGPDDDGDCPALGDYLDFIWYRLMSSADHRAYLHDNVCQ